MLNLRMESKYLKAVLLCTGKNDRRSYLNGVYVEAGNQGLKLVGTDGVRLLAVHLPIASPSPCRFIIPNSALRRLRLRGEVVLEPGGEHTLTIRDGRGVLYTGNTLAGIFPPWRKAVPKTVSGEVGLFNPALIGDFAKVGAYLEGKVQVGRPFLRIFHNGEGTALLQFKHKNVLGCLAPARAELTGLVEVMAMWENTVLAEVDEKGVHGDGT